MNNFLSDREVTKIKDPKPFELLRPFRTIISDVTLNLKPLEKGRSM